MKASVTTRITINASASDVFNYLSDLKYMHLWNPQVRQLSTRKKLTLNSTYETESVVLGISIKALNTVTVFKHNQEIQIENATGMVCYVANFKLTTNRSEAVTLICATTVSSDSTAFAFTTPILKALARRELQTDLQALKIAVEHQVPHNVKTSA